MVSLGRLVVVTAALLFVSLKGQAGETIDGRVVGVVDGDTLTLLDAQLRQRRIRLLGVDAPESGQPFGGASKRQLAGMVFGRPAQARCGKPDRYGREICQVLIDGVDVGQAQIVAGMAWYYVRYGGGLPAVLRAQYGAAQTAARAERRGLWSDAEPRPPWDWRAEARADRKDDGGAGKSAGR
jgi:endonuclease YncB( thermonuclease family)